MTYKYRVTLTGIKGFYRVFEINAANTLYQFHKQMRANMEFPADQLILFKGLDEQGEVVARYGLFDLGCGACDQVTMAQTLKDGVQSLVYFYDTTNRKSVNVTFEGEADHEVKVPTVIDTKGPEPIEFENGYVAFEDLPDEKRHLPGEDAPKKRGSLADILGMNLDDLDDLDDEENDEDEDGDDEDRDEDTEEVIDEDEALNL